MKPRPALGDFVALLLWIGGSLLTWFLFIVTGYSDEYDKYSTPLFFIVPIFMILISIFIYFGTRKQEPEFAKRFKIMVISSAICLLLSLFLGFFGI